MPASTHTSQSKLSVHCTVFTCLNSAHTSQSKSSAVHSVHSTTVHLTAICTLFGATQELRHDSSQSVHCSALQCAVYTLQCALHHSTIVWFIPHSQGSNAAEQASSVHWAATPLLTVKPQWEQAVCCCEHLHHNCAAMQINLLCSAAHP